MVRGGCRGPRDLVQLLPTEDLEMKEFLRWPKMRPWQGELATGEPAKGVSPRLGPKGKLTPVPPGVPA